MHWFLRALAEFELFRRAVIISQIGIMVYMVNLSFTYIMYATSEAVPGTEIVMVVGAFHAPQAVVLGYLMKLYMSLKRSKNNGT